MCVPSQLHSLPSDWIFSLCHNCAAESLTCWTLCKVLLRSWWVRNFWKQLFKLSLLNKKKLKTELPSNVGFFLSLVSTLVYLFLGKKGQTGCDLCSLLRKSSRKLVNRCMRVKVHLKDVKQTLLLHITHQHIQVTYDVTRLQVLFCLKGQFGNLGLKQVSVFGRPPEPRWGQGPCGPHSAIQDRSPCIPDLGPSLNRVASGTTSRPHITQPWDLSAEDWTTCHTLPQWSLTTRKFCYHNDLTSHTTLDGTSVLTPLLQQLIRWLNNAAQSPIWLESACSLQSERSWDFALC